MAGQTDDASLVERIPTADGRKWLAWIIGESDQMIPFDERSTWPTLLDELRQERRPVVVLSTPLLAGPGSSDARRLKQAVGDRGAELRFASDPQPGEIKSLLRIPAIRQLMAGVRRTHVVEVVALSETPLLLGSGPQAISYDDRVVIGLPKGASADDLAHELCHIELEVEGFPVVQVRDDVDERDQRRIPIGLLCAVLDVEVDRRVAAVGLDPTASTDAHAREEIRKGTVVDIDQCFFRLRTLVAPDLREAWLDHLRDTAPANLQAAQRISDALPRDLDPVDFAIAVLALAGASPDTVSLTVAPKRVLDGDDQEGLAEWLARVQDRSREVGLEIDANDDRN